MNKRHLPSLGSRDTRNTLNLVVETNLPGLLSWILLIVSVFMALRRARCDKSLSQMGVNLIGIQRVLVGFLLAGLVGLYAGLTFPYVILAILWAAARIATECARASARRPAATPVR
jgi:hypothetical protein